MKLKLYITLFGIGLAAMIIFPHTGVLAQGTCTDAAGGPIPCPATDEPVRKTPRPTIVASTSTYTPTSTATSTNTPSPTSTSTVTVTVTATKLPPTNTATVTSTSTPIPPQGTTMWMPGIGIGAFILLIIVGILLPAVQKIRVANREE